MIAEKVRRTGIQAKRHISLLQKVDLRACLLSVESQHNDQELELWGGVECTINRVRDQFLEQLKRTGHIDRTTDFCRFAKLGIKALRQPILWESAPSHVTEDERWRWAEAALQELAELNISPIVGLVHHGSGPPGTSLLDPGFPSKLAAYAEEVATRFPHVRDYTPVNEPLTTARFSALYGHWYPHCSDERSFVRALLNECRAVVLAMESIRRINLAARLIQTEDLGKIYSTPALAYQAEFENERRWASFDLLCGRVGREHRMWGHFRWAGIDEAELEWFLEHPCPPDVIGLNHYLSGERYLDEHLDRYPRETHGGNGRNRYADVLAARVLRDGTPGPSALMMEAWERYKVPIAITECHNGCTREEQLRWFLEVWKGAKKARSNGANVIAVTAWSLLGSFDWDSLVTQKNDHYEPGIYDIRSSPPRPTALAHLIRDLASGDRTQTPLLEIPGWWRRPRRFVYGISVDESGRAEPAPKESINRDHPNVRPLLITGGGEALGRAFARICELRGIPHRVISRNSTQLASSSIRQIIVQLRPWAVINTAEYARIDEAEREPGRCFVENAVAARWFARACHEQNIRLLTFSSDQVFDGSTSEPYVESDRRSPINVYGRSKAMAEELVKQEMSSALIVRSGPLFGPCDKSNFVVGALRAMAAQQPLRAATYAIVSPTYIPDLVNTCLELLIDGESGIWHLANSGQLSWADLFSKAAELTNTQSRTLQPCGVDELQRHTPSPRYIALSSEKAILLPAIEDALQRFVKDFELDWEIHDAGPETIAA